MIRIRGKVGQATEPAEYAGKWFFQIWAVPFGEGDARDEHSLGEFGPWETEEIAKKELRAAAEIVSEGIAKKVTGKASGMYIDMKTNLARRWDKRDEH